MNIYIYINTYCSKNSMTQSEFAEATISMASCSGCVRSQVTTTMLGFCVTLVATHVDAQSLYSSCGDKKNNTI